MKKLLGGLALVSSLILVALTVAALVASCGPPVVLPECPAGTRPLVCHQINTAECTDADGLDPVSGCYVRTESLGTEVHLECVASCG